MDVEEEKQIEQRRKSLLEFHAAHFERSTNYTNLVIAAGYAAYFAIWSNVSGLLTQNQKLLSALAMLTSLLVFVFWEVCKMVVMSVHLRKTAKVTQASLEDFESKFDELVESERRILARISVIWPVVLLLVVFCSVFASGVLMYAFVAKLVGF